MDRLKAIMARWLIPVTVVLAIAAVIVRGAVSDVVWPAAVSAVNAIFVSNFFRCRLRGTTAIYLLAQVEPDADGVEYGDGFMLAVAALTLLTPIYLILGGTI